MTSSRKREWLLPVGLLILSAVPVIAGAVRVTQLAGGGGVTPENARFFASPVPVLIHIVGATVYCILGAFQFASGLRRRRPRWHRIAGRILIPCGLAAALSGLWMTVFYPSPPGDNALLTGIRLVVGPAMIGCIVLGFVAIRSRDFARHRAWMARGYALGLGAGTQVLTHLPWILLGSQPRGTTRALLMLAGWVINLAVTEWVLRSRPFTPARARVRPGGNRVLSA
jgi:uncharacterized membrane protein